MTRAHPAPSPPGAVVDLIGALRAQGQEAWISGESLLALALARPEPPRSFEVATSAGLEALLAAFPHAVPTQPAHGIVTVPSAAGPVDLLPLGPQGIEGDLARRDFTVLAMAWDPTRDAWLDPFGGRDDLAEGRLRAVGDPLARLVDDPLRALRAARLLAEEGLVPDPALEAALPDVAGDLADLPPARVRRELVRILLAPGVAAALALMRRTHLEAALATGVREDASAIVAALPPVLHLRLAGWLRGASAARSLRRLRFGLAFSHTVHRLLEAHPLDEKLELGRGEHPSRSVQRLLRVLPAADLAALFRLRELELERAGASEAAAARKRLDRVHNAFERARRAQEIERRRVALAVSGEDVMAILGCGPGRRVGSALRHLASLVDADPSCNEPERLTAALRAWAAAGDPEPPR